MYPYLVHEKGVDRSGIFLEETAAAHATTTRVPNAATPVPPTLGGDWCAARHRRHQSPTAGLEVRLSKLSWVGSSQGAG